MSLTDLLTQLSEISSSLYRATFPSTDDSSFGLGLGLGLDIPDFLVPFPELVLDVPSCGGGCLVDRLVGVGASLEIARELSEIHAECAAELADNCTRAYREACLQLANDRPHADNTSLTKTYLRLQRTDRRLYKQTIEAWEVDLIRSVQRRYNSREYGNLTTGPSMFKTNFSPILEEVFKENPFPSISVKKALASKLGLSLNQIKIWFQNHRSRARKNGINIRKKCKQGKNQETSSSPSSVPPASDCTSKSSHRPGQEDGTCAVQSKRGCSVLEIVDRHPEHASNRPTDTSQTFPITTRFPFEEGHTSYYTKSHISESDSSAPSDCETVVDSGADRLNVESPLSRSSSVTLLDDVSDCLHYQPPYYAFPTPYPPDVDEDPFPCRAHGYFSFPKFRWPRSPNSKPIEYAVTDVSDLVCKFSSLTLSPSDGDDPSSASSSFVTTYPLITTTYSAPLPFAVRNNQILTKPTGPLLSSRQQSQSTPTSCALSQSRNCTTNYGKVDHRDSLVLLNKINSRQGLLLDVPQCGTGEHCQPRTTGAPLVKVSPDVETIGDVPPISCTDSSPTWWFEEIFSEFPDPIGLSPSFTIVPWPVESSAIQFTD